MSDNNIINAKISRAKENLTGMIDALKNDDMVLFERLLERWNASEGDREAIVDLIGVREGISKFENILDGIKNKHR